MSGKVAYKLTYFNLRARAEVSRLLFAVAGVEYEDFRVDKSRWPDLKPSTPYGQVPVLEIENGIRLCQSKTIGRFLANRFGLAGKTDVEKGQADMIVDCIDDIITPTVAMFNEKDSSKQMEMKKKFEDEQLPTFIASLEKLLVSNNGGDHYFVGDSLTWADLVFFELDGWLTALECPIRFEHAPKLKALKERIASIPQVDAWVKKRPVTAI